MIGIASESNADWLQSHGVIPVAYGAGIADRLADAAPQGIDPFIELFGPEYVELAVDFGMARGRIETIISWDKAEELGTKQDGSVSASTPEVLEYRASLVADGTIELPIARTDPVERVSDAFAEVEERHTHGKVVLVP